MAASQARYLALVARKSNCEYEGQQINQARTALSNQSANLFNQMLGLKIPIPPSTQDYTTTQYSFKDGLGQGSTITKWEQLANDPDYNFVVTRHYNINRYTGSLKKMADPQVHLSTGTPSSVDQIETAMRLVTQTKREYEEAKEATAAKKAEAATLSNYADVDNYTGIFENSYDPITDTFDVGMQNPIYQTIGDKDYPVYTGADGNEYVRKEDGKYYDKTAGTTPAPANAEPLEVKLDAKSYSSFVGYSKLTDEADQEAVKAAIQQLVDIGALDKDTAKEADFADVYYNAADGTIAFKQDLRNLYGGSYGGLNTNLKSYNVSADKGTTINELTEKYNTEIATLQAAEFLALTSYDAAKLAYDNLEKPTSVGNSDLELLADLTKDQAAELKQIVDDMRDQGANSAIEGCFNSHGEYIGGVYQFKLNGVTYYTTYTDLNDAYESANSINDIDAQSKLVYYNASYVSTPVEETEKALVETDGGGRFSTIKFESDSVVYTLNMETITDDAAYNDAMNQYLYENAVYDKTIRDINAKTSIIQQEDQQLELRLKQLDTEQKALSTEMEAVKKVTNDNIEAGFKTFNG